MWQDFLHFVRISRPLNVFISLLAFGVGCYLATNQSLSFLQEATFWATALMIGLIAATGYWINDVYDYRIDRINKPHKPVVNAILSVKKVLTVYFVVNVGIMLFTLGYLSWYKGHLEISFINLLSIGLLFVYASYLKRIGVPGNLTIAFLTALVLVLAGYLYEITLPLVWAIVFAFEITFIREVTKDVEDIPGDLAFNLHTLPIQIGIRHTKTILWVLYACFLVSTYLPFAYAWWQGHDLLWTYLILSVLLVQLPCAYLLRLLLRSQAPADFTRQSRYLKYLTLAGIFTLFFLG